ncbi:MAG: NAD(P)-dependent glycerol-3-phosphate dehydrogenase [Polyangiaceae bacterium]|nr:NAD(P)-dependent glycerol-3-phosphate dehydrogenase [Polyangiaceae bacterium]
MSQICVLGAGAWGTALAKVLADKGNPTLIWAVDDGVAATINEAHENKRYLPGHQLPPNLKATTSLEEALAGVELIVVVVPSHAVREVMTKAKPLIPKSALLCSASKGIENDSLMLMSQVIEDVLGHEAVPRLTYLSGPSFAKEVALGMPTAVVVAGKDADNTLTVQRAFASDKLRVYSSHDVIGVEIGGALKNVIAIAAGAIDGLGFGHNSRAGMITRGLHEIGMLAMRLGGEPMTVAGLSGMGDLVLTCTGDLSRNRTVGVELGKGRKLDEILRGLGHVAEGVKTSKSAYDLSIREGVEMPITHEVYKVLYEGKHPRQAVVDIMTRELRSER